MCVEPQKEQDAEPGASEPREWGLVSTLLENAREKSRPGQQKKVEDKEMSREELQDTWLPQPPELSRATPRHSVGKESGQQRPQSGSAQLPQSSQSPRRTQLQGGLSRSLCAPQLVRGVGWFLQCGGAPGLELARQALPHGAAPQPPTHVKAETSLSVSVPPEEQAQTMPVSVHALTPSATHVHSGPGVQLVFIFLITFLCGFTAELRCSLLVTHGPHQRAAQGLRHLHQLGRTARAWGFVQRRPPSAQEQPSSAADTAAKRLDTGLAFPASAIPSSLEESPRGPRSRGSQPPAVKEHKHLL